MQQLTAPYHRHVGIKSDIVFVGSHDLVHGISIHYPQRGSECTVNTHMYLQPFGFPFSSYWKFACPR